MIGQRAAHTPGRSQRRSWGPDHRPGTFRGQESRLSCAQVTKKKPTRFSKAQVIDHTAERQRTLAAGWGTPPEERQESPQSPFLHGAPSEPSPPRSLGCDGEQGQRDQERAGRCLTLAHPAQESELHPETGRGMGPGPTRPPFPERRPGGWEAKGWGGPGTGVRGLEGLWDWGSELGVVRELGEGQETGGARGLGVTGRGYIVQESGGPGFMKGSLVEF